MEAIDYLILGFGSVSALFTLFLAKSTSANLNEAITTGHEVELLERAHLVSQMFQARRKLESDPKEPVPMVITSYNKVAWDRSVEPVRHIISGRDNPNEPTVRGVNGLPFTLRIVDNQGNRHNLLSQMRETEISKEVLACEAIEETPWTASSWFSFLNFFNVKDLAFRHSRVNTCFTLKATGLSMYGVLHLEDSKQLRYTVKFVAKTVSEILEELKRRTNAAQGKTILAAMGVVLFGAIAYGFGNRLFERWLERRNAGDDAVRQAEAALLTDYLLARPQHRLNCGNCGHNPSDMSLPCGHLTLCENCYNNRYPCPECHEEPENGIKIYPS